MSSHTNGSELLKLTEVANILRVAPSTIYRLIVAGKIPAFKIGRDWRFHPDALRRWLDEQQNEFALAHKSET